MKKDNKCEISHCRNEVGIFYYDHGICSKCWNKFALLDVDKLKKELNIKEKQNDSKEPRNV